MNERQRPKDDADLVEQTGIKPADHDWVSTAMLKELRRKMLGPTWGKKRRPMEGWPK